MSAQSLPPAHVPGRPGVEDPAAPVPHAASVRGLALAFLLLPGLPLAAWVLGDALQLAQPRLWPAGCYGVLAGMALLLAVPACRHRGALRAGLGSLAALLAAFALVGLRASHFTGQALDPALEGRELVLTGTVAAMPQHHPYGLRLRLAVDAATLEGRPVAVPPLVDLGWYGPGPETGLLAAESGPPALRAGDRWCLPVRLKAPHGSRNPHGFDYELWAWEQGIQATGTVRGGRGSAAPQRLDASAWRHPVEAARQAVRDAIFARLAPAPGGDPVAAAARLRAAGVVAALVTGDQQAIARVDWDTFRATGVAHLMSISGLHITMCA